MYPTSTFSHNPAWICQFRFPSMGNLTSVSSFDHLAHLANFECDKKYCTEYQPQDNENPLLGPVYRTTLGTKGVVNMDLRSGIDDEVEGGLKHDLFSAFLIGKRAGGDDAPFLSSRVFKAEPSTKSGYVERKDGSIDRFDFADLSFQRTHDDAIALGRGLISLGLKTGANVSIFAPNSPEWVVFALGLYTQDMCVVPIYPTLGPDSVEFVINLTETECIVVSADSIVKLSKAMAKRPEIGQIIRKIIVFDNAYEDIFGNVDKVDPAYVTEMKEKYNIDVFGFSEVLQNGKAAADSIPITLAKRESNAFLLFTSGTTGANPKGVELTHGHLTSCIGCVSDIIRLPVGIRLFLYLPLQHILAVVLAFIAILVGGRIFFSQGDVKQIANDMILCKPQLLPSVPRVFVKFFQVIWQNVQQMPFYKRWYIYRAYNHQLNCIRTGKPVDETYDSRVIQVFREKLGLDQIEIILTGGSPTPAFCAEFIKVLLGKKANHWFSGFGSSESCGGVAVTAPGYNDTELVGTIGGVIPALEWRFMSVPDMDYNHSDKPFPRGELLLHGNTIFNGYYKDPQATEDTFIIDSEGRRWLKLGDVARLNTGNMSLSIIDRKKACLKLSQGEYVSFEKLISTYSACPIVTQIFPYGNSFKSCMVAIVAPNPGSLYDFAVSQHLWSIDEQPVPGSLTDTVRAEFDRIGQKHQDELIKWAAPELAKYDSGLLGFEKVRKIYVETHYDDALGQAWNEHNNLQTPTMKLKYGPLARHYVEEIKQMYHALDEPEAEGDVWY